MRPARKSAEHSGLVTVMTSHRLARVVVLASQNPVGVSVAQALSAQAEVHLVVPAAGPVVSWQGTPGLMFQPAQLLAIADLEVALAGADAVLVLPALNPVEARLRQGSSAVVRDACLDTVRRALASSSVRVLVSSVADAVVLQSKSFGGQHAKVDDALVQEPGAWIEAARCALGLRSGESVQSPQSPSKVPSASLAVLSVQRFEAPSVSTGEALAEGYFAWLRKRILGLTAKSIDGTVVLRQFGVKLLSLRAVHAGTSPEVQVYVAEDGLLLRRDGLGHFEFRVLPATGEALVILRGFEPALPFWLYRLTHAQVHQFSVNRFAKTLTAGSA
jgi:hypothetical protein